MGQELLQPQVPLPPEAAAISKFGDIDVSLYTGTPSISIPIYTINTGDVELPISLDYHASGNKVTEEASWVGLGWSLNAGGVITRDIRGSDDLTSGTGFLAHVNDLPLPPPINNDCNIAWDVDSDGVAEMYLWETENSEKDYFPTMSPYNNNDWSSDLYSVSYPAGVGKFIIVGANEQQTLIHSDAKIERKNSGSTTNWEITDEKGTVYKYESKQYSNIDEQKYITAWYLTSIVPVKGENSKITFEYSSALNVQGIPKLIQLVRTGNPCNQPLTSESIQSVDFDVFYPEKITFPNGYVEFIEDTANPRLDLSGAKRLRYIKVYSSINGVDQLIKTVELETSYFEASGSTGYANKISLDDEANLISKRLKLEALTINDGRYDFSYNGKNLLPKTSYGIDHWGYANRASNSTLVPDNEARPGADREVHEDYVESNVLSSIQYPTGGKTDFVFEPHLLGIISGDTKWVMQEKKEYVRIGYQQYATELITPSTSPNFDYTYNLEVPSNLSGTMQCKASFSAIGPYSFGTASLTINGNGNQTFHNLPQGTEVNFQQYLEGGNYLLQFNLPSGASGIDMDPESGNAMLYFEVIWEELVEVPVADYLEYGPGLRIKQIINDDGDGQITTKNYSYGGGELMVKTVYSYPNYCETTSGRTVGLEMHSRPVYDENLFNGSIVGYDKVTVELGGEGSIGKEVYNYYNERPYESVHYNPFSCSVAVQPGSLPTLPIIRPLETPFFADMQNGNLLSKEVYKANDSGQPIYTLVNTYSDSEMSDNSKVFHQILLHTHFETVNPDWNSGSHVETVMFFYPINSDKNQLISKVESDLDNGQWITKTTNFFYGSDQHLQIVKEEHSSSSGGTQAISYRYSEDYAGGALTGLIGRNMVGVPIETFRWVNDRITGASAVSFDEDELPSDFYSLEIVNPLDNFSGSSNGVSFDAYELKASILTRDAGGNVTSQQMANNTVTSFIWGYNSKYPVAKVEGANYSEISSYASNIQSKSNLDDDTCQGTTGCDEANLRAALNALRNGVSGAMVTTYTYDPLVGMTSQTDSNGRTTYYEYDDFGRLERVIDDEGNPVSAYEYNYKNQ
ncbi:RHS repeat domain-containing protein [Reichenbachiella ulvae]|uniref:RHS repeat protein n=1 Tax=Reichenbachiella ulvae TaxID=2980104 RepID=A0ABT3CUR5_9BACT|nr:RHS repeat domain-containing protein [Reichenbachiella ulvae]MCV9387440.1 RHS repeat protein [Reichenbachiella ulvae]